LAGLDSSTRPILVFVSVRESFRGKQFPHQSKDANALNDFGAVQPRA
jgi:hypothetical protein